MIVAQTFFDEFHPDQIVPPTRYAAESIAVMAEQGMVRVTTDPTPALQPKRGKTSAAVKEVTDGTN